MFNLILTTQAEKDLNRLQKTDRKKISKKLDLVELNPYDGKKLSGELDGFYSFRAWPYRIIYFLKKNNVWVTHIMHRKDIYKVK